MISLDETANAQKAQLQWHELASRTESCLDFSWSGGLQVFWEKNAERLMSHEKLLSHPLRRWPSLWSAPPSTGSLLKTEEQLLPAYYLLKNPNQMCRVMESLRFGKTSQIFKSNH